MTRAAPAQSVAARYSKMAPIQQYLMDRGAEIALAGSAAPEAVSRDAQILVLGPHGHETAVAGSNGFVCMVEWGWAGEFDYPEYWNPKLRGPDCLNPAAARSLVPVVELKTKMVLEGHSKEEIIAAIKAAYARKELPALQPVAMGYMMSKAAYLTDAGGHNLAPLMMFVPLTKAAAWGADLPKSPVASAPYWFAPGYMKLTLQGLPPILVFVVSVPAWSDGTPAS